MTAISVQQLIGDNYGHGWWTTIPNVRYRIFKGARSTKKSYNMIGLEPVLKILSDKRRNCLIIRQYFNTLKISCYASIKYAIYNILHIDPYFKFNETNMEIIYKPTGQQILFKGLNEPEAITSARPNNFPYFTDIYIEEGFEIKKFEDFDIIDGAFRGNNVCDIQPQVTICFNAWSVKHWLYDKFFKGRLEDDISYLETHPYQDALFPDLVILKGRGLYLHISTYRCNEFRNSIKDEEAEHARIHSPDIYKCEYLGCWGNAQGSAYPEWSDTLLINSLDDIHITQWCIGLDTGLSSGDGRKPVNGRYRSATTMQLVGLCEDRQHIISVDEYFDSNEGRLVAKTEPEVINEITDTLRQWVAYYSLGAYTLHIFVDCADIGFMDNLVRACKDKRLYNIKVGPATKLPIEARVQFIRQCMAWDEYWVHRRCVNLIREIKNSQKGVNGEARENLDDHCLNANEYGWYSWHNIIKRYTNLKWRT